MGTESRAIAVPGAAGYRGWILSRSWSDRVRWIWRRIFHRERKIARRPESVAGKGAWPTPQEAEKFKRQLEQRIAKIHFTALPPI
ncbi:MAG: hypothetical protein ACYTHM_19300 [Planctomycetota bacterium]